MPLGWRPKSAYTLPSRGGPSCSPPSTTQPPAPPSVSAAEGAFQGLGAERAESTSLLAAGFIAREAAPKDPRAGRWLPDYQFGYRNVDAPKCALDAIEIGFLTDILVPQELGPGSVGRVGQVLNGAFPLGRANEPAADPGTPRETESGDRYCERGSSRSRSEKRRCQSAHLPDTLVVRPPTFLQQSSRRTAAELRPRPFEPSTNAVVVIASRQVGDDEREHVQPLGDVLGGRALTGCVAVKRSVERFPGAL